MELQFIIIVIQQGMALLSFSAADSLQSHRDFLVANSCVDIDKFDEDGLLCVLRSLPDNLTSGHDHLQRFIIKDCTYVLVTPLFNIFNTIIGKSVFPECWKLVRVCPVLGCQKNLPFRPFCMESYEKVLSGTVLVG